MQNNDTRYYSGEKRGVTQRVGSSKIGKKARKSGYLTAQTAAMWIAYAAVLVMNALIEGGRLGGVTSADVTFQVFTWFTPAPYVFAIWSVVYIAIAVWLVGYTRNAPLRTQRFGPTEVLFVASCALNIVWLTVFHLQFVTLALIVIAALWVVMAALYLTVRRTSTSGIGWIPISIYTAWVTVATVTNAANLITRWLDGGIPVLNELSVIALSAGVLALGYLMRARYKDSVVQIVFLWAIVGVGVNVVPANAFVALIVFLLAAAAAVLTYVPANSLKNLRRAVAAS